MNNRLKSNDDTLTYYSGTNRLKTAYADSFAYNGDGSATFVGGDVSKYNWKNRVEHIDVQDGWVDHDFFYDYDYQGLRVRKEEKRVEEVIFHGKLVFNVRYYYTYYLYGKNGELLCEYDNNGNLKRKYIYLPKTVIQIVQNDTFYIYLDNRGSPVVVTDEEGSVKKQYRYYAFGKLRAQPGSFNTDYSFTGYLKEETGTHYARMRYYEGGIGWFLRPDPIGGLNPYLYCGNDPINFVDPWGTMRQDVGYLIRDPGTAHTGPIGMTGLDASGVPFQWTFDEYYAKVHQRFLKAARESSRILPTPRPFGGFELKTLSVDFSLDNPLIVFRPIFSPLGDLVGFEVVVLNGNLERVWSGLGDTRNIDGFQEILSEYNSGTWAKRPTVGEGWQILDGLNGHTGIFIHSGLGESLGCLHIMNDYGGFLNASGWHNGRGAMVDIYIEPEAPVAPYGTYVEP